MRSHITRRQIFALFGALVLASASVRAETAVASGTSAPRVAIEATVAEVLGVLQNQSLSNDQRRDGVTRIAYERFDFRTMSRLVLSRNWRTLSDGEQEEFQAEFKTYLANEYGERLDEYSDQSVRILGERQEPRGDVTVKTQIVEGEVPSLDVDYRLRDRDGQWRVIDVVIEGISLVSNYRDQFKEVLKRGGAPKLLEELRKKNAERAAS